jgi:flagellin-specific chaperone FliS
MSVIHTFSFSLSPSYVYIAQTFDHFFHRIIMANISELLRQIRQVENEHNQLVDEYFQISKKQILSQFYVK